MYRRSDQQQRTKNEGRTLIKRRIPAPPLPRVLHHDRRAPIQRRHGVLAAAPERGLIVLEGQVEHRVQARVNGEPQPVGRPLEGVGVEVCSGETRS